MTENVGYGWQYQVDQDTNYDREVAMELRGVLLFGRFWVHAKGLSGDRNAYTEDNGRWKSWRSIYPYLYTVF